MKMSQFFNRYNNRQPFIINPYNNNNTFTRRISLNNHNYLSNNINNHHTTNLHTNYHLNHNNINIPRNNKQIFLNQINHKIHNILAKLDQHQLSTNNKENSISNYTHKSKLSKNSHHSHAFTSTLYKLRSKQQNNYLYPYSLQKDYRTYDSQPFKLNQTFSQSSVKINNYQKNKNNYQFLQGQIKQQRRKSYNQNHKRFNYSNGLENKQFQLRHKYQSQKDFYPNNKDNKGQKQQLNEHININIKNKCTNESYIPKQYPRNYIDIKDRYKTQPNQNYHQNKQRQKKDYNNNQQLITNIENQKQVNHYNHKRLNTQPHSNYKTSNHNQQNQKRLLYNHNNNKSSIKNNNYKINQQQKINKDKSYLAYQQSYQVIQNIRSKYYKTPPKKHHQNQKQSNYSSYSHHQQLNKTKSISTSKLSQNIIIQIPQLKLKNGKNINQAIQQIQVKIDRCNQIKSTIVPQKQKQKQKENKYNTFKNYENKNKKNASCNEQIVLKDTGNFSNLIQNPHKNINYADKKQKSQLNHFTFNKNQKQNILNLNKQYNFQAKKHLSFNETQTKNLVNAISNQIHLDSQFRKAKNWLSSWNQPKKWDILLQKFIEKGITYMNKQTLKQVYQIRQQENDPFYSFRDEHQNIQSLINKYLSCEQHWIRNIFQKFNYQKLIRQGFIEKVQSATYIQGQNPEKQKNSNNIKVNIIFSISCLIRLLNFEFGQLYRIRDVCIIYERLSKDRPLTLRNFLEQITKSPS